MLIFWALYQFHKQFEDCSVEQALDGSEKASLSQINFIRGTVLAESMPYTEVCLYENKKIFNMHLTNFIVFLLQDLQNIAAKYIDYILELSLAHNHEHSICIVVASDDSLQLLVKHGQELTFMDGTWHLIGHDMQVVVKIVKHPNGKVRIYLNLI